MMRIAFVSNVVYPFVKGGAEKRIHEIGTRLADAGHDVTVYGRHFWDGPQELEHEGMTLRAVAPERALYNGERRSILEAIDFSAHLATTLRRHAWEHDLIVASVFPYFPVLAAKLDTLGTDIPLVITWHEAWGAYWEEYLGLLALFGKTVEYITARTPHYPLAVSGVTADRLSQIGPERERIRVVPNGIDVDEITGTTPADEGFDVLYAGRLADHKNVDLLLQAFDRIAERRDVTLGIVGDGPEGDSLRTLAGRCNASDRITFLGFLDEHKDVIAQMRAANVFVSPSTREGFGITCAEAMAAGCTVIGVEHPESATSEVIGDAGLLAEPTVDSVANALASALDGECFANDPAMTVKQYDWSEIATQAEAAYRAAIDGAW